MLSIGIWSDFRHKADLEIFQRKNQLVCREFNSPFSNGDVVECELLDRSSGCPFIIDKVLDTLEKQKQVFFVLKDFEIDKEGKVSLLPYNPCHAWLLTATQVVTLYQANEASNPDYLIWQIVNHGERMQLSRIPADEAITHSIQDCHTPQERTACLKDRRITLIHDDQGNLRSISITAELIKSKLDNSKIITSDNWAVTIVVSADLDASGSGFYAFMERSGHSSIVIETVENLTHKIYRAHLMVEDLKWNGLGRAVVHLDEFDNEHFDANRYQGQSETMVAPKARVEKMMRRIRWEIAQQNQGTPKIHYFIPGSSVNGSFHKIIDVFSSMEIYQATQMIDPPATAINFSPLKPPSSEAIWEQLDDPIDIDSVNQGGISTLARVFIASFKDAAALYKKLREIKKQALKVQNEAYNAAVEALKQPDQKERIQALTNEKGFLGATKAFMEEATEAGKAARRDYERSFKAELPNLIRVRERSHSQIEVETLPDNCDTWAMHKVSLIGKRVYLNAFSELCSIPSDQIGKFVVEDIPFSPDPTELPIDPERFLELICETGDSVRIAEAKALVSSMAESSQQA